MRSKIKWKLPRLERKKINYTGDSSGGYRKGHPSRSPRQGDQNDRISSEY